MRNQHVTFSQSDPANATSDATINISLQHTPSQIGSQLNNLANRSDFISDKLRSSQSFAQDIKERELRLVNHAKQLLEFKNQLEKEKQEFTENLKNEETRLINQIMSITKQSADVQTKYSEISINIEKNNSLKSQMSLKVNDLRGMGDDLTKEEKEIATKISVFESKITEIPALSEIKTEIHNTDEEIIKKSTIIEEIKKSVNVFTTKIETTHNEQQKVESELKKLSAKLENKRKTDENTILKRELSVQTEQFKLFDFRQKENDQKSKKLNNDIKYLDEKTSVTKETIKDCHRKTEQKKYLHKLYRQQMKDVIEETQQIDIVNKLMKQCKTVKEFDILKKIKSTIEKKNNVLRQIGEMKAQKSDFLKIKIPLLSVRLKKCEKSIENADKVDELIKKASFKIKAKEKKYNDFCSLQNSEYLKAIETLEQLNNHLALSQKIEQDLISHKFINLYETKIVKNYENTNNETKEKIIKTKNEIKNIKENILKLEVLERKRYNLIKCSLFCHQTSNKANFEQFDDFHEKNSYRNSIFHEMTNQKTNKKCNCMQLRELLEFHKQNITKRKTFLAERRKRIQNVCDFYGDSHIQLPNNEIRFCNCIFKLYYGKHIRSIDSLLDKILIEGEIWKHSQYGTPEMLTSWNNQIEHML